MITKSCRRCRIEKHLHEFHRNKTCQDGFCASCKDCYAERRGKIRKNRVWNCQLTDNQLAYLAGLLDGEGYLGITRQTRQSGAYAGDLVLHARMVIGITCQHILIIRDEYGVGVIYKSKARKHNHKDRLDWTIRVHEIKGLLPRLVPYLKIKQLQAELLLKYFDLPRTRDEMYRSQATAIYEELRRLNYRGKR